MNRYVCFASTAAALIVLGCLSRAEAAGIDLKAADAGISGGADYFAEGDFIGAWNDPHARLQWEVTLAEATTAKVELNHSCAPGNGGKFVLTIDRQRLSGETHSTGGWYTYQIMDLGQVKLAKGRHIVTLQAGPFQHAAMNVKFIRLSPAQGTAKMYLSPLPDVALPPTFIVPNFHPASCGWLANWSVERNYCANSYLNHLDRVRDDANYGFAMSECNNMIAIANFLPSRFVELKQRVKEGRVELVNAFFLEPTINLSGGEALAKMGIEGLRWQEQVMGSRPRFCWTIDVCGTHAQMPQLCQQLGLEALVYTRCSRAQKGLFWSESPDGSRVLTIVPGHYSEDIGGVFSRRETVRPAQLAGAARYIAAKMKHYPDGSPVLVLGGCGDYALAPAGKQNPSEFLAKWHDFQPKTEVRFTGLGKFVDALMPDVRSGKIDLAIVKGGTRFTFDSFWIQSPNVKTWYRRDEHALQAAETLATIASLKTDYAYPVQDFYHGWLQMLLNMDRNTLWGAAGGMVFEDKTSWDARDRFQWVEDRSKAATQAAMTKLAGQGEAVGLFNPANFPRTDVLRLRLPKGKVLEGTVSQQLDDGTVLCRHQLPSGGCQGVALIDAPPKAGMTEMPEAWEVLDTPFYFVRIDRRTGALTSLLAKPSERELLSAPANVIVAEAHRGQGDPGDFTASRPLRPRRGSSSDEPAKIRTRVGPLATVLEIESPFVGGRLKRTVLFYHQHPRIDFETEISDIPDKTVVVAEFPLAETPSVVRRGIPFGFAVESTAQATAEAPELAQGIEPAVRWSHYTLPSGSGLALLDRGLSGRELNGKVPVIYLYNANEKYYGYPNSWLSGKGKHKFEYALLPDGGDWAKAQVARQAWEYNCPVSVIPGCAASAPQSFFSTSDNVIVEVVRREGDEIEMRLVECLGLSGEAQVTINLPHQQAALTDLVGGHRQPLAGGPAYEFPIRPQQIVTLRLKTAASVAAVKPLMDWEPLVPPSKRPALRKYLPAAIGHPPSG